MPVRKLPPCPALTTVLPAPAAAPPTRLWLAPFSSRMPICPVPQLALPARSVPMRLPWITVPLESPLTKMPPRTGEAIQLPSLAPVPPTRTLSAPPKMWMPCPPLPSAPVPAAFTPIQLPRTTLPSLVSPSMCTPVPSLPLMTLCWTALLPPIVLALAPFWISTPSTTLPRSSRPVASVPM